jgi:hypothetical protein
MKDLPVLVPKLHAALVGHVWPTSIEGRTFAILLLRKYIWQAPRTMETELYVLSVSYALTEDFYSSNA